MARPRLHSVLTLASVLAFCLPALATPPGASAAPVHQTAPPGIDPAHPAVSGRLVAKPITGEEPTGTVICGDRDRGPDVRASVIRGLVICTEEGQLVLLQISGKTGLFNRNWQRMAVRGMALGDHLNAWGVLRDGGNVLDPTYAVQDTSRPVSRQRMVSGRLVAKPITGEEPTGAVICGDRDRGPDVRAAVIRGLVICTEEGQLILLQLSPSTRIVTRDPRATTVADLTLGDQLNAWGVLIDNGNVMDPTARVEDIDLQARSTGSQDFIRNTGQTLTLFVLQSDAGGPVQGRVYAQQRGTAHVTLCGGAHGAWSSLRLGMTIDVTGSIFNVRTMTYVDTDYVRVVNCR